MSRGLGFVVGCLFACAIMRSAPGQAVLVTDARDVMARAFAQANGSSDSQGPATLTPPGFGAAWDSNNSVSAIANVVGAGMAVSAIQLSSFSPGLIEGQGSVSLSTTIGAGAVNPSTSGSGRSSCVFEFDVPIGAHLQLVASRTGVGSIQLLAVGGGVLASGSGVFDLTAPTSRLRMSGTAIADLTAPPSGSAGGGYSFSLTVVPSPGGSALAAVACVTGGVRRKRGTAQRREARPHVCTTPPS